MLKSMGRIAATAISGLSILVSGIASQTESEARPAIALLDVTVVDVVTGELLSVASRPRSLR